MQWMMMAGLPYMQLCTGIVLKLLNYLCLMEQMLHAPLKWLVYIFMCVREHVHVLSLALCFCRERL